MPKPSRCLFCGAEITPEPIVVLVGGTDKGGWLYQCESLHCEAIYSCVGRHPLPDVQVAYRPAYQNDELDFESKRADRDR